MNEWFRERASKLVDPLIDEDGATTVEYAIIVAAIILVAIVTIFLLASPDGTGVVPNTFNNVGNKVGQFGKIE